MNTNNSSIQEYRNLERESHISLDDVINKVTQEVAELIEANQNGDINEEYNESCDVLTNIYSVSDHLGLQIDLNKNQNKNKDPINLSILHGKWNSKIQALRGRYSREDINSEEAGLITSELVNEVLSYSDPKLNIEDIIGNSLEKFNSRIKEYKPILNVKDYITSCPNFPKPGIDFKDISPILESPKALKYICMELANKCKDSDVITGLDSRGFLFGTMVAEYLGIPFVMIRKKGKLPGKTKSQDYGLEYGSDVIEIQEGAIKEGQKVSVIDDLLATGGTAKAAIDLIEDSGGEVNNVSFVISLDEAELSGLDSRKALEQYKPNSIVNYL